MQNIMDRCNKGSFNLCNAECNVLRVMKNIIDQYKARYKGPL